jgi:hypothetical protein
MNKYYAVRCSAEDSRAIQKEVKLASARLGKKSGKAILTALKFLNKKLKEGGY